MSPQDEFSSFEKFEEPQPQAPQPESAGGADEFASFEAEASNAWEDARAFAADVAADAEGDATKDNLAIASTVVGVLSLCLAIVPLCGFPLSLAALGLGAFSLKAPNRRTLAIVGMVLGGLAILLSICSAAFGVLSMLGQQTGY